MQYYHLILLIQLPILTMYVIYLFIYNLQRKLELRKLEKINKDDKEKFQYYREILKSYSIGELGYLFNGKKKTNLLIMAELEWLKLKGYIKIKKEGIEIIQDKNIPKSTQYLLTNYNLLNDKETKPNYLKVIESALLKKQCLKKHKFKLDNKLFISLVIFFLSFLGGWYLTLNNKTSESFMIIESIIFLIVGVIFLISIKTFGKQSAMIKTDMGKEIYLKLNGLKNYIKDFGNFDERRLKEIVLWEEYILYAIILDEGKTLQKEAKEELNTLQKITENKKRD